MAKLLDPDPLMAGIAGWPQGAAAGLVASVPRTGGPQYRPIPRPISSSGYAGASGQWPGPGRLLPARVARWYPPVVEYPIQHNGFAILGATLGSLAFGVSLLPVLGMLSWLLAPIGLTLSAIGLVVGLIRHAGRMGALWGIATSALALGICLAWVALAHLL